MAATTKIQAFGNSLGGTLNKDVLATAGFARSDEVRVEATRDRVVITRPDSDYAKAMDGYDLDVTERDAVAATFALAKNKMDHAALSKWIRDNAIKRDR